MKIRIRLRSRLFIILTAAALIMQFIDPSQTWVILIVSLGLIFLVSSLWARNLSRSLWLQREMRFGWAQVGDLLEERFTLSNSNWLPAVWVEVKDESDMPGYQASRVTGVEGGSSNSWRTHGQCTQRGLFKLGPTSMSTGDPFGIYSVELHDPASTTLMVMPPILPLPMIEVAPGGRSGEGRPRRDAPERTVAASNVRQYVPGDSLRWIHWPTTARRDPPYVRIFDGTPAGDWWIFLDMDRKVQLGAGWDSTTENAIILAASLADQGLRMRRAVGLVANGEELVWLPPSEGSERRWEILRSLALVKPGDFTLAELLNRTRSSIRGRSSLVIVTPNTHQDWIEALIPLLWRGAVPTVLLLDPATFDPSQPPAAAPGVASALSQLGVRHYVFTRQMLDMPEAHPGQKGHLEFRISPRGRAIAVNPSADATWRTLT